MSSEGAPVLCLASLAAFIAAQLTLHRPYLIGLDGRAGSGKTTFAASLVRALRSTRITAQVLALDEAGFWIKQSTYPVEPDASRVAEDYDWRRLKAEILTPIRSGISKPPPWTRRSVVIIEGCFTLRNELHDLYDLKIFMHVPKEELLKRAMRMDESLAYYLNYWTHQEDRYVKLHEPLAKAHLIVDGRGGNLTDSWLLAFATVLSQRLKNMTT